MPSYTVKVTRVGPISTPLDAVHVEVTCPYEVFSQEMGEDFDLPKFVRELNATPRRRRKSQAKTEPTP